MTATDAQPEGLTNEFREARPTFRGRKYHLRELSIGDYDGVVRASTDKIMIEDVEVERVDNQRQSRLLLTKMIVSCEPPLPANGIAGLGTGVVGQLTRIVNELLYADEADESKVVDPKAKKAKKDDEDEETPKGNV